MQTNVFKGSLCQHLSSCCTLSAPTYHRRKALLAAFKHEKDNEDATNFMRNHVVLYEFPDCPEPVGVLPMKGSGT